MKLCRPHTCQPLLQGIPRHVSPSVSPGRQLVCRELIWTEPRLPLLPRAQITQSLEPEFKFAATET